jgi:GH15 family glucan-1,4-alpha-glucosidase
MAQYVDPDSGLPRPSYDLWEERLGIHAYTVIEVIEALKAVCEVEPELEAELRPVRDHMEVAVRREFGDCDDNGQERLARSLIVDSTGFKRDSLADASLLPALGALYPDPSRCEAVRKLIERDLAVRTRVGGMARYPGDYYFRRTEAAPGNPWIIATLWNAQARLRTNLSEPDHAVEALNWAMALASPAGMLPEQVHAETGEVLSVSPLPWSHAEFLATCLALQNTLKKQRNDATRTAEVTDAPALRVD